MKLDWKYAEENFFSTYDCIRFFKPSWEDSKCQQLSHKYNFHLMAMFQIIDKLNELFGAKIIGFENEDYIGNFE